MSDPAEEQQDSPNVAVIERPEPVLPVVKSRRRWPRWVLMLVLPLGLLVGGGWYWVTGGRYVSTENAYVQQDKVAISPEIAGRVAEVYVHQNQLVGQGDMLFTIDDATYRIDLEKAESAVASARLNVEQMRSAYRDAVVKGESARETLSYQQNMLARQEKLRKTGVNTETQLEQSRHALNIARQSVAEAEQAVISAKAALNGDPAIVTDRHPVVETAIAERDQAKLNLEHTAIRAPSPGTISQTASLQVGEYVRAGTPVVAIVQTGHSWVEANFNETELAHIRAGQPATLALDAYPDQLLKAEVESIGAGTGSTFSLLPAQNATGNWVKVVQRVPVRLKIADNEKLPALQSGLSVAVSVDTGHVRPLPKVVTNLLARLGMSSIAMAEVKK